jgi:uncharacterized protein
LNKFFLIPFLILPLGLFYCHYKSRPKLEPFLVALSVALFPTLFWFIRSLGPFFGGADIGAGLILMASSLVSLPIIVIVFYINYQWTIRSALKNSGLVLAFGLLFSLLNHVLLLKQHEAYKQKSELNCDTVPFHCAIRDNQIERIQILKAQGHDLESKDGWGRTALFHAYYSTGKRDYFKKLLEQGANANQTDESGYPIIQIVLFSNPIDLKIAELLIEFGADVNMLYGKHKKISLLNDAVIRKNNELVNFLLAKGANPQLKDGYGYSACDRLKVHSVYGLETLEAKCQ